MRLDVIETFVTIVDAGSMREAARRLGVSKSVVSHRLAALEGDLGTSLIQRTTRAQALTDAGALFYERCQRIIQDFREATELVGACRESLSGPLRLAAPNTFGVKHLMPVLEDFLRQHPGIVPTVDFNDRVVDIVGGGYDLAVRIGRLADSTLIAKKLAPARSVVIASPDYLARHGTPRTVEDLAHHRAAGYVSLRPYEEWSFVGPGERRRTARVPAAMHLNNGEAQVAAAAAGFCLACLPRFIAAEAVADGRVVALALDAEPDHGAIYAVYAEQQRLSGRIRTLVDHLAKAFAGFDP
jgi:DNA-binding transcriptional LysR family regulator